MKCALWIVVVVLAVLTLRAGGQESGTNVFESASLPVPESRLDKIVFESLSELKIQPVLCSDEVFLRRAYLDVIGTLPTAKEAREFIGNRDEKNKRRLLVDRLLERDEFADYWAMNGETFCASKPSFR